MLELVDNPPAVIFTTAFDEYAIRAFESHAVDYLLKPFNKERFDKAIQKWLERYGVPALTESGKANADNFRTATQALLETAAQSPAQQHRIVVKTNGKIRIIPV